ncbi:META domain-containing protein [Mangrovibacterium marinum]|uniref:META domain-containing protein n=1 Tax=Mangrovibacterium marinum TaxID=1639118 RepID=A0A2T5C133_9BACT|nr:META domain-containing protein [Mangrovibacterium marinum]PTN08321.1 META domain-containing protein [Mangrovibacterium marinum]
MPQLAHSVIFMVLCLAIVACEKIDGPAADVYKTWEVTRFVAIDETMDNDDAKPIYFALYDDGHYMVQLGVNSCGGSILNITDNYLILAMPACTEMCCDSEFAVRFAELIPAISMYRMTGDLLRLYVKDWGFIECVRSDVE